MRTFEYRDAKSAKFWNIEVEGTKYTVTFGKLGSKGQTQTKDFGTQEKAKAAAEKLIAEKVGKGYSETTRGGADAPSTGTILERALVENPDDLAAYGAYGDWLSQQGDPRGEFIGVQRLLEDPDRPAKERKDLQKQETKLLEAHQRDWLGPLAPYLLDQEGQSEYVEGKNEFRFARGWLDRLLIPGLNIGLAKAMTKAPQVRLLRELIIEQTAYAEDDPTADEDEEFGDDYTPSLTILQRCPYLGNVRIFRLGELGESVSDEYPRCHTDGRAAADLVKAMPRLEELYLHAHQVDMEKLFKLKTLTNLRVLQVYHSLQTPLEVLANNPTFAHLTRLSFFPHALEPDDDEAYITLAGVRALARSKHLTRLTHLQLRQSNMGDEGVTEIIRSGLLKRLKSLDLMHGRVTDAGARALAASPDIKHLENLNLSHNGLTQDGIDALKATGVPLRAEGQHKPGTNEGYEEYLGAGDIE